MAAAEEVPGRLSGTLVEPNRTTRMSRLSKSGVSGVLLPRTLGQLETSSRLRCRWRAGRRRSGIRVYQISAFVNPRPHRGGGG